jgi:hypothetical protein
MERRLRALQFFFLERLSKSTLVAGADVASGETPAG